MSQQWTISSLISALALVALAIFARADGLAGISASQPASFAQTGALNPNG